MTKENPRVRTRKAVELDEETNVEVVARHVESEPKSRSWVWVIVGLVITGLIAALLYTYFYFTSDEYREKAAAKEVAELITEIGTKMILPVGEEPAIFDITDPAQLASQQAFFVGAEQGDKLLVYSTTAKAIIYSQSRGLIVNVGPVTFDENSLGTPVGGAVPAALDTEINMPVLPEAETNVLPESGAELEAGTIEETN